MKINYDFPWYLQNSEAFMTMYNGLYTVASNISPLPFLECLNIDELTYFEQLRALTWIFGLFGSLVSVEDALIYDVNNWSVDGTVENYWSGNPVDDLSLLRNYIKAKVQIRNKNLTLQTIKQFFSTCLAHREFDADTDIQVTESTLHFDITVTVNQDILNDMASLYATDPYPFGKPVGISYSINYVQE